jgi:hypothetical protein
MVALKKVRTDWLLADTLILNNHNIKRIFGAAGPDSHRWQ